MKLSFKTIIIVLSFFSESYFCQSNYSLGITFGSGMNIYKNDIAENKDHFNTNNPLSIYFGLKLVKHLDEENKLFADLLITRKKIEHTYNLNEPEIPLTDKDVFGQKYNCISFFVGYRKLFPINEKSIYIEASVGADYNDNVMSYNVGNGESYDNLSETAYFKKYYNTNLGEKSYTISSNVGLGLNFGERNQYDAGISMNIPIQKIQTKESNYQSTWNYKAKEYFHDLKYIGHIYYPSLRFTYYFF